MNIPDCNSAEKQFNFLQYLRDCHQHYRTREPQTANSISERRRYAQIYRDMRAIEPPKPTNPYAEVMR